MDDRGIEHDGFYADSHVTPRMARQAELSAQPADLTEAQWAAVNHFEGPLLVVAGPGSGKTRVVTRRVARLIERGVPPWAILAITFTNKAAREMSDRVERLLPGSRVWVSTFHRLCAKILRQHGAAVGLSPNFTILDTTDQRSLLKQLLSNLDIDGTHYPPAKLGQKISAAKNRLITAEQMALGVADGRGGFQDGVISKVYTAYQAALLASNAVDFDDLLLHVAVMLRENDELRAQLDARFRFILVDEYQDTNLAQYQIVRALSQDFPNLSATGDPDQSIYGWRGAEIGNILSFERDYPGTKVVRLEQNYRSTPEILELADRLIAHNAQRKRKDLFTDNPSGEKPVVLCFLDERDEADGIAATIRDLHEREGRPWSDVAIVYRVNALSRQLELALGRAGIPYKVAAGVAFYERTEVKDIVAYLRLIQNPADRTAFLRVVNTPGRGLGQTSVDRLLSWADNQGVTALDAARDATKVPKMTKKAAVGFAAFARLIDELSSTATGGVESLIRLLLARTGYTAPLERSTDEQDQQRLANVEELLSAAGDYDREHADDPTLDSFLENASLVSDTDAIDQEAGHVSLMTLHAAKGLEFPTVFVVAVEYNLIPHERAIRDGDPAQLEEERRLLFVGMTRAMDRLFLTQTQMRQFRGARLSSIPSPFLEEARITPVAAGIQAVWRGQSLEGRAALLEHQGNSSSSRDDETYDAPFDVDNSPTVAGVAAEKSADNDADETSFDFGLAATPPERSVSPRPAPATTSSLASRGVFSAADLLPGAKPQPDNESLFRVGQTVRHPRLGLGKVLHAQGTGKWRTVTVAFDDGHEQSFVALRCPLQPVGMS
jgi:DNA helicase-2/ATP-dependent DNA helicase PcrA